MLCEISVQSTSHLVNVCPFRETSRQRCPSMCARARNRRVSAQTCNPDGRTALVRERAAWTQNHRPSVSVAPRSSPACLKRILMLEGRPHASGTSRSCRLNFDRTRYSGYHRRQMAKHSFSILELARRGARHRYEELQQELASLARQFPELRASAREIVKRGRRAVRPPRQKCDLASGAK